MAHNRDQPGFSGALIVSNSTFAWAKVTINSGEHMHGKIDMFISVYLVCPMLLNVYTQNNKH